MRKVLMALWLLLIASGLTIHFTVFANDLDATLSRVQTLAEENLAEVTIGYILLLAIRGLTLMPSTPLLFVGIVLFPPWTAYWMNMVGIFMSSLIVILAINHLNFGQRLERLRTQRYARMERRLRQHGLPIIVSWSFFPLVPTDLIVYLATLLRFQKRVILGGVMTGEAVLNAAYVFGGASVLALLLA
ncbi:VTT domain-containing protein [Salinispirillum marinum]|uniref:VTT domain-containing protein n=2 Tax=Saccharospirillaceae TaxID=255527 RepID=A0ABV8BGR2_9GAMM